MSTTASVWRFVFLRGVEVSLTLGSMLVAITTANPNSAAIETTARRATLRFKRGSPSTRWDQSCTRPTVFAPSPLVHRDTPRQNPPTPTLQSLPIQHPATVPRSYRLAESMQLSAAVLLANFRAVADAQITQVLAFFAVIGDVCNASRTKSLHRLPILHRPAPCLFSQSRLVNSRCHWRAWISTGMALPLLPSRFPQEHNPSTERTAKAARSLRSAA